MGIGELFYRLQALAESDFARLILSNAMLHAKGWYEPSYSRSGIAAFFD
jgi:hypothetical protein